MTISSKISIKQKKKMNRSKKIEKLIKIMIHYNSKKNKRMKKKILKNSLNKKIKMNQIKIDIKV